MGLRSYIYNFLRKSESFMKTDMVYLTKGGFWLSLGQLAAMATGLISSILFANLFPKEAFGSYKFILSMVAMMSVFTLTGMFTAVTQAVAKGFNNALRQGFRINLKWSLGLMLSGLVLSIY